MSRILIKRSSTPDSIPQTTDLSSGELAVNTNDGKLFFKKTVGSTSTIIKISDDYNDLINTPTDVSVFNNDANYLTSSSFSLTGTETTTGSVPTQGTLAFLSQYGMSITADENTITIGTPQDLQSNASPVFAGLTTSTITNGLKTWGFNTTGVLQLPAGGDIVDSHGTSVLGGATVLYSVRYDINNQGLSLNEQANARENINAISTEDAFIFALIM